MNHSEESKYHQFNADEANQQALSIQVLNQTRLLKRTKFFFFYNAGSGGTKAEQLNQYDVITTVKAYLNIKNQQVTLTIDSTIFSIYFVSLIKKESLDKGLEYLKEYINSQDSELNIVIGGGDGTTIWVVESLIKAKIDILKCVIIPFPFGTGNDFSNSLGWGTCVPDEILGKNFCQLKRYIQTWDKGLVTYFDLWDVNVQAHKNGSFQKVQKVNQNYIKITIRDDNQEILTTFNKKMSNYFSVGVDARIGMGFDKSRSSYKCWNKCIYCWEGFKKLFIKTKGMGEIVDDFGPLHEKILRKSIADVQRIESQVQDTYGSTPTANFIQFQTIQGNPVNLLCLNINSYSAGVKDIWKNAPTDSTRKHIQETSFSDGQLEFMTFNSIFGIVKERYIGGFASKVAQGSGPFRIQFRESQEELITYFQVDGEYLQVTNPDYIEIKKCSSVPDGRIKVLVNNK